MTSDLPLKEEICILVNVLKKRIIHTQDDVVVESYQEDYNDGLGPRQVSVAKVLDPLGKEDIVVNVVGDTILALQELLRFLQEEKVENNILGN